MSTWYRTGTVTVTNGSASVTGILTGWTDGLVKDGDALFVPASSSYPGEILTVNGSTSITLNAAWHGTNQTSVAYFIFKGMEWGDVTRLATEISELIDNQVAIIGGTGAPSDSDGYADGTRYFRDDAPEYYVKTAGSYGSPISLTGPTGPASVITGTSTTSRTLGTGSMAFTTQAGIGWVVGTRLRFTSAANPTTHYMEGVVTAYSSTSLTATMDRFVGTGTRTDWNISACGDAGATGATGASYAGTSTTSLAIGTGTKVFTTQSGLAYVVGSRVRAANTADTANYMEGRVTSYSGTSLTLSVDVTGGSGTLASWNLSIAGDRGIQGVQGIQGDQGIQGATGPGYAATSTTSLAIGTGSKVFTTQAGLSYVVGASRARASSTNGANYVEGLVTAYSGTSLTISADTTGGSGTISTWNISLAGTPGTNGTNGTNGVNGTVTATTSTTSNTTATGSKSFTTAATTGLTYSVGQRLRIVSASNTSNWMSGLVTSFAGTSLVVNVDLIGPSPATATDWNIALTGEKGDPGAAGGFASLTATKGNWPLGDGTTFGTFSVGADGTMAVADSAATYGASWRAIDAVHADGYWSRSTVASAATCDIGAASTTYVTISGTTTITSLGTGANKLRFVQFSGSLTLTYNGTSLILPGAQNIITAAGDSGIFISDGIGNWRCIAWTPIGYLTRERLLANRTYYVRADGSDSNNGLANTAGGAFLTLQKLFNVIVTLDLAGFTVTGTIDAGTFAGFTLSAPIVGGNVVLSGAGAASTTVGAILISGAQTGVLTLQNMKFVATGSGIRLDAASKVVVSSGNEFGACTSRHVLVAAPGGFIHLSSAYTISGGATQHMDCQYNGIIRNDNKTITLTGTPAFTQFAAVSNGGGLVVSSLTFSGSATGQRYNANSNGFINTGGGGASYLPGSTAGTDNSGAGLYV